MNYKEKYEKALERAKCYKGLRAEMEIVFPELKESEGERIRKALIHYFSEQDGILTAINGSVSVGDILAWLEKQGEQKPTWSEEDEKILNTVIAEGDLKPSEIYWLKSLKERMKGE